MTNCQTTCHLNSKREPTRSFYRLVDGQFRRLSSIISRKQLHPNICGNLIPVRSDALVLTPVRA